jgi:hypothetical protein
LHVVFCLLQLQLCPAPPVPISALCLAAQVPAMAQNQTSICGLKRISPSPKIKFGFTCQPRNPKVEASRSLSSFAQSPDGEAWQIALLCISVTVSIPCPSGGVAGHSQLCVERPFFAVYGHQVSHQFARHGQCGPIAISFLLFALVNQRQLCVPARSQFRCFDQHGLQVLVSLF